MIVMMVSERKTPYHKISRPEDAYEAVKKYHNKRKEHFIVLTLSTSNEVIAVRLITIGLLNRSLVHPREIFWWAIKDNAAAIILVHNHPSGSVQPSSEDREITERLVEASKIMGIPVLDHVVVSKTGYYSFLEMGEMSNT